MIVFVQDAIDLFAASEFFVSSAQPHLWITCKTVACDWRKSFIFHSLDFVLLLLKECDTTKGSSYFELMISMHGAFIAAQQLKRFLK